MRRLALLVVLLAAAPGRADPVTQVSLDTLVYADDDKVIVVSPQAAVSRALDDDGSKVSARGAVDIVSAASVDVVSQATRGFDENRYVAELAFAKRIAGTLGSASYRYSGEPDYVSHGGVLGIERRLGSPDTVLSIDYGFTWDTIGLHGTAFSDWSRNLATHTVDASVTQNLGLRTVLRVVGTFVGQAGYMAKPYQHVPLFDQAGIDRAAADGVTIGLDNFGDYRLASMPPERVPDRRWRGALAALLIRDLGARDAVLRASYRLYADSWGVTAHTVDASVDAAFGRMRLELRDRLNVETAADFWQREYVVSDAAHAPAYRSLDRELGGGIADTLGVGARWEVGSFVWYVDFDATYSKFDAFLLLDHRLALVAQVGLRWTP